MGDDELSELIHSRMRVVEDYPKPGVRFQDITPLLGDGPAFAAVVDALAAHAGVGAVDSVIGIEARGFILAAPLAYSLRAGFVPIRKSGKLPAQTHSATYDLEYGTASMEVHADAIKPGDRVLIVDDVLATGGTAAAAVALVRQAGGTVVGFSVLMELAFLHGRRKLTDVEPYALSVV